MKIEKCALLNKYGLITDYEFQNLPPEVWPAVSPDLIPDYHNLLGRITLWCSDKCNYTKLLSIKYYDHCHYYSANTTFSCSFICGVYLNILTVRVCKSFFLFLSIPVLSLTDGCLEWAFRLENEIFISGPRNIKMYRTVKIHFLKEGGLNCYSGTYVNMTLLHIQY